MEDDGVEEGGKEGDAWVQDSFPQRYRQNVVWTIA
jgi:hypothetical protein